MKTMIRGELNRRKELKGKMTQMNKIRLMLSEILTKYTRNNYLILFINHFYIAF